MTERERVIRGLECCTQEGPDSCRRCPYNRADTGGGCDGCGRIMKDALELLRAPADEALARDLEEAAEKVQEAHFRGWGEVTMVIRRAAEALEEREGLK